MGGSCQSIGSLFYRSSQQLPKASIGVVVEDGSKTTTPENEPFFSVKKSAHISLGKVAEKENLDRGKLSPWVSTRSVRQETPDPALNNRSVQETDKCTEGRSETLRLKLWEALGDASQSKHVLTQDPESEKKENPKCENKEDHQRKPIRDTDTIETDSGNRKAPAAKLCSKRTARTSTRSTEKKMEPMMTRSTKRRLGKNDSKSETKNIFTFDDCEKKIERTKDSKVEPRKLSFFSGSTSAKSLQSTDNKVAKSPSPIRPPNSFSEKMAHNSGSNFNARNPKGSDGSPTFDPAVSPTFAVSATPPFQKEEPTPVLSDASSSGSDERHQEHTGGSSRSSGSPLVLPRSKRLPILEESETRLPDPSSDLPFYTSRSADTASASSPGTLDPSLEDDNLGRAIAQLAVVMDRFKAKIRSYTSMKGSEILSAAKDSFHLQLQEVESLIQADAEKLAGHSRSKRKRLESAVLDQQEKLKGVYDRFREEVDLHLASCRSSLDDLEAYEEELRGNVDRQKSAHRKILLQVEEAMQSRLAEAEANVAAIQKAARRKMKGLKGALREWLTDDYS